MLSCKEIVALVTDYLEGRMPLWDRLRFRMHLAMCSGCTEYIRQMKLSIAATGQLPDEPVPEGVERLLVERFRNWKP